MGMVLTLGADGRGGGGDTQTESQEERRGDPVEEPFEVGKTSERHDTHLSV